jgi:hypothetical protein
VKANLYIPHFERRSFAALVLSFVIVIGMLSNAFAKPVSAKTVRLAVISYLSGDVTVKKGGGYKSYDAYTNMSLNQGDILYTGYDSSVVLNVSSNDAEITLGSYSEFNISDLRGSSGGKIAKLRLWAGSIWVKVKSLLGYNDEFDVETPTAVMGVRGTQFFVGVDATSGKTTMAVGAGKVRAATLTNAEDGKQHLNSAMLYPTQQITLDARDEVGDLTLKVKPMNVEKIVGQASPDVIKAIIKNKKEMDDENAQFIRDQKQRLERGEALDSNVSLMIKDQDDLGKITKNMDNLVGNIAKNALDKKVMTQDQMQQVIDAANSKITDDQKKLDLGKVEPFDITAGVDQEKEKQRLDQLEKIEAYKKKKREEMLKQQEELKKRLAKFLKQSEENRKQIAQLNARAEAEAKKKAEESLLAKLTPVEAENYRANKTDAAPAPVTTAITAPAAGPTPTVQLSAEKVNDSDFTLDINLIDFTDMYAVEAHLLYDKQIQAAHMDKDLVNVAHDEVSSNNLFSSGESVELAKEYDNEAHRELVYAVTNYGSANEISNIHNKLLVRIPFTSLAGTESEVPSTITLGYIKIVKKDGTVIYTDESQKVSITVPVH